MNEPPKYSVFHSGSAALYDSSICLCPGHGVAYHGTARHGPDALVGADCLPRVLNI